MRPIDAATLIGLSCHLGPARAIEFAAAAARNKGLDEVQQKLLMRGWLAIEHLPKDAILEAENLYKCLSALRRAWVLLAEMSCERRGG